MTAKQREKILADLKRGATYADAAAAARVPWREFASEYAAGRDLENGLYADVESARATCRTALRILASEQAGTRASSDALKLLAHLEQESPPEDVTDDPLGNVWRSAMPDELAAAVEAAFLAYPVDAGALADSAGDWTPKGAALAADDHESRRSDDA